MILDQNSEEQQRFEQHNLVEQANEPNQANLGLSYDLSHPIVHHALDKQHKYKQHDSVDLAKMLSEAGVLHEITMSPEQYIQLIKDVVSNDSNTWKDHLYEGHYSHMSRLITMSERFNNHIPGTGQRIFHPDVLSRWKIRPSNFAMESGHLEASESNPIR